MAGAKPEYLPTILAIAETGLTSLSSSTNSFATAAVINGPIRDTLNMNYGIGAMGPFSQPNAAIGRAWTMLSKNLSNSGIPGQTYLGTLGNSVNYNNLIIAENEKNSPWTPLSVQKGFKQDENVVSVFVGFSISQGQGGIGLGVKPVPQYHEAIAYNCIPFGPLFGALIVCDPLVAQGLVELGYKTKGTTRGLAPEKLANFGEERALDAFRGPLGARSEDAGRHDGSLLPASRRVQLRCRGRPNESLPHGWEHELSCEYLDRQMGLISTVGLSR